MASMRILLASDFYPPTPGGLEAHVERLKSALVHRGHDVSVVAGSMRVGQHTALSDPAVEYVTPAVARVPGLYQTGRAFHPPWPDPAVTGYLDRVLRRTRPDVVHAHGWIMYSAAKAAENAGVPAVATLHDYPTACPKRSLLRHGRECETGRGRHCLTCDSESQGFARRVGLAGAMALATPRMVDRLSAVVAVSESVRHAAVRSGVPDGKVHVIPNFVSAGTLSSAVGGDRRDFLFVGSDLPAKGAIVLSTAFGIARSAASGYRLVMVGTEPEMRPTPDPGVVTLGRIGPAETLALYSKCAVLVVPSIWPEPCPTVALEAMASGCTVVASRVGGLPEIVDDEYSGLLVPPGDSRALAAAMARLESDPHLRARLASQGRRRVESFSSANIVPRLESLYHSVSSIPLGRNLHRPGFQT